MHEESEAGKRFHERLPYFVNGTLTATEQAWVKTYVEQNKTAGIELELTKSLQNVARLTPEAVDDEARVRVLLARIQAETSTILALTLPSREEKKWLHGTAMAETTRWSARKSIVVMLIVMAILFGAWLTSN